MRRRTRGRKHRRTNGTDTLVSADSTTPAGLCAKASLTALVPGTTQPRPSPAWLKAVAVIDTALFFFALRTLCSPSPLHPPCTKRRSGTLRRRCAPPGALDAAFRADGVSSKAPELLASLTLFLLAPDRCFQGNRGNRLSSQYRSETANCEASGCFIRPRRRQASRFMRLDQQRNLYKNRELPTLGQVLQLQAATKLNIWRDVPPPQRTRKACWEAADNFLESLRKKAQSRWPDG